MKRGRKPWNIPAEEIRLKATGTTRPLPATRREGAKSRGRRPPPLRSALDAPPFPWAVLVASGGGPVVPPWLDGPP